MATPPVHSYTIVVFPESDAGLDDPMVVMDIIWEAIRDRKYAGALNFQITKNSKPCHHTRALCQECERERSL